MNPTFQVAPITDKAILRAYFSQDRPLYGYALGDLEEGMWQISTYLGAFRDGKLESVALIWRGVEPPVLVQFGTDEAAAALFSYLPDKVFYMLPAAMMPVYQQHFETPAKIDSLWRMQVTPSSFKSTQAQPETTRRLTESDVTALQRLYADDGPRAEVIEALSASQINSGVFFGVFQQDRLVAVAGSHFCSPNESVAAVGYVYTTAAERGKGYATLATSAVTQTFFETGIRDVILNVAQPNAPAIRAYEKLGFRIHAAIMEGYGIRPHANQR